MQGKIDENEETNEYPVLSFDETFEIASKIKAMGGVVKVSELAKALNMKRGGWFALQLMSLRRWGLVEGRGELCLTNIFKRLMAPQRPNDDAEARLEAFLNVQFFKKLYDKYKDHGLPDDPYFTNTLKDSYGLSGRNPALVARIVRQFITKYVPNYGQQGAGMIKEEAQLSASIPTKQSIQAKGNFPIIIESPDGTFDWDIKNELDWAVVEAAINSIKERWKLKQKEGKLQGDTS